MSFIPNKTTFTKYHLTQWISKLVGSFEIHWVRQYLVNFMGLAGIFRECNCFQAEANFYRYWAWLIVLIFNTAIITALSRLILIIISAIIHVLMCSECHDDVIKWNHFPRYRPFVRGIHRSPVNSLHKGQWRGALMLSLICTWIYGWVNNHESGDLRRHRAIMTSL